MLRDSVISSKFINAYLIKIAYLPLIRMWLCVLCLSPPQRLPLGIPIKIAIIEKQEARGGERSCVVFFSNLTI